jgi:hypothetical protein
MIKYLISELCQLTSFSVFLLLEKKNDDCTLLSLPANPSLSTGYSIFKLFRV